MKQTELVHIADIPVDGEYTDRNGRPLYVWSNMGSYMVARVIDAERVEYIASHASRAVAIGISLNYLNRVSTDPDAEVWPWAMDWNHERQEWEARWDGKPLAGWPGKVWSTDRERWVTE